MEDARTLSAIKAPKRIPIGVIRENITIIKIL
jgi:hypothetical protein